MEDVKAGAPHQYLSQYKLGTGRLPMIVNQSPEIFEAEREKIFKRSWMNVGRVEDALNPGDYFVQDIPTLETSVLIVRGRDGKIRGFHNMCQHRGNKVVHSGHMRGNAKGFSCAFHGWTYDLTGKLVIVPDEDQFFDFDKSSRGLRPIETDTWEGFVFVALDPKESLKDWLGDLYGKFEGYFQDLHLYAHFAANVKCNWKIFLDAFLEGYHVPFIHGKTLPEAITGEINPLCHLQSVRIVKWHHQLGAYGNPEYQPTPVEKAIARYMDIPVFPSLKGDLEKLPPGINPERDPMWGFDINHIFPVTFFGAWANGSLLIYHFWPTAVDETRWEVKLYWDKPKTAAQLINREITGAMTIAVVREDLSSLETTQEVYNSGAMNYINLSDQEVAVRHNYQVVEEFLAG